MSLSKASISLIVHTCSIHTLIHHVQQLQDVNDLVSNIERNIQQIVDKIHEYLRRFVAF